MQFFNSFAMKKCSENKIFIILIGYLLIRNSRVYRLSNRANVFLFAQSTGRSSVWYFCSFDFVCELFSAWLIIHIYILCVEFRKWHNLFNYLWCGNFWAKMKKPYHIIRLKSCSNDYLIQNCFDGIAGAQRSADISWKMRHLYIVTTLEATSHHLFLPDTVWIGW